MLKMEEEYSAGKKAKSLIVVYSDELALNQLRKCVDTDDDTEEQIVGTKDGSVKIIAWDEKMWFEQKRVGKIQTKRLFIGDVKGIKEDLAPTIDIKYDSHGIKYGWSGDQALVIADVDALSDKDKYNAFFAEFKQELGKEIFPELYDKKNETLQEKVKQYSKKGVWALVLPKIGWTVLVGLEIKDYFSDKSKVKKQQLLLGVTRLYKYHLEEFMNL